MMQQTQHPIPFFHFLCAVAALWGLFALCASPVAASVDGALMTGKTLSLLCNSPKEDDRFACQTYIAGVVDYHRLIKSLGTAPSVDFCLPKNLTMDQIKALVTRYIATHTEHQDFIAAPAVAMSLFNAYPCKKRRK